MRTTRLRLALVAAVQVAWLAAPHHALSRPEPHDPTIVVEAEAAARRPQRDGAPGSDGVGRSVRALLRSGAASAVRRRAGGRQPAPARRRAVRARRLHHGRPRAPDRGGRDGHGRPDASTSGPWRPPWPGGPTPSGSSSASGVSTRLDPLVLRRLRRPHHRRRRPGPVARAWWSSCRSRTRGRAAGTAMPSRARRRSATGRRSPPASTAIRTSSTRCSTSRRTGPLPTAGRSGATEGRRSATREHRPSAIRSVLEAIRATGATNVVIADAGQFGQRLDGVPLLHDPLGQVAYGVHPYLTHSLREPEDWEPGFGFFRPSTRWWRPNGRRSPGCGSANREWETTAPQLVDYLQTHDIGMLGWAFDVTRHADPDWQYRPTSLEGFRCGGVQPWRRGAARSPSMPGWRPHVSPCETGLSDEGVVAVPVDVPSTRDVPPLEPRDEGQGGDGLRGRRFIQVDDACPVPAWEAPGRNGNWSWRDGAWLPSCNWSAGRHTVRFLGRRRRRRTSTASS